MTEQLIQRLEHALKVIIDDKITLSVPPQPTDVDVIIYATIEYLKVQAAQQKEGYVFVKPQLDSDAKAKMIGEYNVPVSSVCPDCIGEGCCECNNDGTTIQNVIVPWTTVKQIYKDGIFFMGN